MALHSEKDGHAEEGRSISASMRRLLEEWPSFWFCVSAMKTFIERRGEERIALNVVPIRHGASNGARGIQSVEVSDSYHFYCDPDCDRDGSPHRN
ncbi:hypothetical protein OIU76_007688 [Salix suchowensis]|nr:hypothetical protein OIU76_007688 [Salix suchowensis]